MNVYSKYQRRKLRINNRCLDCGTLICPESEYCVKCSGKQKYKGTSTSLHPGETHQDVKERVGNLCIDCGILIAPQSTRCKSCEQKYRRGQGWLPHGNARIKRICEICDTEFWAKKSLVDRGGGRFCSRKCTYAYRRTLKREKAWWIWKGGKRNEYGDGWDNELRERVRNRDRQMCVLCGDEYNGGRRLTVHHIDYGKSNNHSSNLVALCKRCHGKVHKTGNEQHWIALFLDYIAWHGA